jgi:hypothetical protein
MSNRRPGNRQIANAAPAGNPKMAATAVAEKLTVRESATMGAKVVADITFGMPQEGGANQDAQVLMERSFIDALQPPEVRTARRACLAELDRLSRGDLSGFV